MICPSCSERFPAPAKHCIHCGIAITRRSVQMAQLVNNSGWIARRALGGFFAGACGWMLAMAVMRIHLLSAESTVMNSLSDLLKFFPGQTPFTTAIGGCFLGTVGGIIERSGYKAFLGGFLGALGGILAGFSFPLFERLFSGNLYHYSFSMAGVWSICGAMVGFSSGLLEGTKSKIAAGLTGGFLGGLLAGGVGSQMFGAMLMEFDNAERISWLMGRLLEAFSGGIVGVHLWFFLGVAEKLYIFRRRQLLEATKKVCDFCHAENDLKAWYCAQCGAALQVAASREQIQVTPFRGLERIANAFQFISWLFATIGVVTAVVIFVTFLIQNFLFALFGSLFVALAIYMLSIIFKALADTIKMTIQIADKLTKV